MAQLSTWTDAMKTSRDRRPDNSKQTVNEEEEYEEEFEEYDEEFEEEPPDIAPSKMLYTKPDIDVPAKVFGGSEKLSRYFEMVKLCFTIVTCPFQQRQHPQDPCNIKSTE